VNAHAFSRSGAMSWDRDKSAVKMIGRVEQLVYVPLAFVHCAHHVGRKIFVLLPGKAQQRARSHVARYSSRSAYEGGWNKIEQVWPSRYNTPSGPQLARSSSHQPLMV